MITEIHRKNSVYLLVLLKNQSLTYSKIVDAGLSILFSLLNLGPSVYPTPLSQ